MLIWSDASTLFLSLDAIYSAWSIRLVRFPTEFTVGLLIFFNSIFNSDWLLFNISVCLFWIQFPNPGSLCLCFLGQSSACSVLILDWRNGGAHPCSPHTLQHSSVGTAFTPAQADPDLWALVMLSLSTLLLLNACELMNYTFYWQVQYLPPFVSEHVAY